MSKLFDTLEQIRENEEAAPPKSAGRPARDPKRVKGPVRPIVLIFFILGIILCVTLFFIDFSLFIPQSSSPDSPSVAVSPEQPVAQPTASAPISQPQTTSEKPIVSSDDPNKIRQVLTNTTLNSKQRALLLNNLATHHILKNDHWKGISLLEEARKLTPDSPDILINYAVALTELGIYEVAALYYEEAYQINPAHPQLIKNIALLKRNNIMGEKLMSLYGQ